MSDNAYEPLLSTDETEALLQAMRSSGGADNSAKEVELGSPDQRLRKTLGKADDVARVWAAEVRKILRRMLGVSASVRESNADVVPYSVVAQSLAPGSAICALKSQDGANCFMVLGTGLTNFVINRRLGGAAVKQEGAVDDVRNFLSAVDRRIVRPFCEEVLASFCATWGVADLTLAIAEVLARPIDMPRLGQFEPMLRISLQVSFGVDENQELSLVLSGDAIRSQPQAEASLPDPVRPADRNRMVARLALAELELVAVLGQTASTVRKVLSLNVGDVIRLEEAPSAPLQVYVEGKKKMLGSPVVSHGNVAVEITQMLKGEP
jgi:flagellar motor switch protein FliM